MPQFRITSVGIAAVACLAALNPAAHAATPLTALRYASDIAVALGGTTVTPANVAEDNLAGAVSLVNVGAIPPDAHVDAYQLLANGDQLLSFDTTVSLPGNVVARPADVVRFNGSAFTVEFDAAANGVPEGVNTDAVAVSDGDLLLSFDTSVQLGGSSFEDEDIVRFKNGQFMPFFNGATAGVPSDLDLDGAQVIGPNRVLVSFDGSGTVGSVSFNANDVLEYDSDAGTWEVVYRGSVQHDGWEDANLVALYGVVAAPSPTPTPTALPSTTATSTPVATETTVPSPTSTALPPTTATPTPVVTETTVPSPTSTALPPTTATLTPVVTETTMPLPTSTALPPATATPTPVATETIMPSPTPTVPPGSTPTDTPLSGTPTVTPMPGCVGDCNGDGEVTVDELLKMVNVALEIAEVSTCLAGDANANGAITINEILIAVNHALSGC